MSIRKIQRDIEDKMFTELSGAQLDDREILILRACAIVATQAIVEERREFQRDLEVTRKGIDEAQAFSSAMSRVLTRGN